MAGEAVPTRQWKDNTMGNRAIITNKDKQLAIYLHWNGGRDSVEAFAEYCKMKGYRTGDYGFARMCQVIGNYFGGGLSVGVMPYPGDEEASSIADDNGVYVLDKWEIVSRVYPYEADEFNEQSEYDLAEMLREIDAKQPESERLGAFLDSTEIPVSELRVGDKVWMEDYLDENWSLHEVIGLGTRDAVNGRGFLGKPYVAKYGLDTEGGPEMNPNNYPHVFGETCRIAPRG